MDCNTVGPESCHRGLAALNHSVNSTHRGLAAASTEQRALREVWMPALAMVTVCCSITYDHMGASSSRSTVRISSRCAADRARKWLEPTYNSPSSWNHTYELTRHTKASPQDAPVPSNCSEKTWPQPQHRLTALIIPSQINIQTQT